MLNSPGTQRPFKECPQETLRQINVILTDIDDTITSNGRLPAASLAAIEKLTEAGIIVIPVTGRPAGWCDHIARMWPVAAVVGENGALYFSYDREKRKMRSYYAKESEERISDREKLNRLRNDVLHKVPGAGIASDQNYREADLAIDFCEDVDPLSEEQVRQILDILEKGGATTKVSSIHVNAWFGAYDKLTTSRKCLIDLFDIDMDTQNQSIMFVGDSPNDVPMFAYFQNSVGVANVRKFNLTNDPTWVTSREDAAGFQEITEAILSARSG
jgi:hypothetical protein